MAPPTTSGSTAALTDAAREAVASACARIDDAAGADAVDGVPPTLVARPADTAQVSEVLKACAAHGLTVVPRGHGTKLSWGTAPRSADVLLDVSGLDQVLDHAAGDLILATQAGTPLAEVQRVAAGGDQRLVLDETVAGGPGGSGSTVGGVLAANTSGARRTAVGTARDLLIGITLVRADGVVAKAGGRVVKNVAGYDLGKLLIGSFGTLGVIVDATFRLHPLPTAQRWLTVPVADPAAALACTQSILHAQVVPAAIEVGWRDGAGEVSLLLEGREDGVAGRAATARALLGPSVSESTDPPADGATYPWDVTARGDARSTALKLTFALGGLGEVLAAAAGTSAELRGSAGSGVLYAALPADLPLEAVRLAVDRLRAACTARGGALVVVDAPAAVKAAVDGWGPVPALDLMRRVKDQFDPDHRLAPGRFVGGI